MSDIAWLFLAFVAVWAGIGVYLYSLNRRQKALERRLRDVDTRPGS